MSVDGGRAGDETPGVSLVVPNYNGRDLLRANVPTLLAAARAYEAAGGGPVEVIVVDDGSSDGSLLLLETELPRVRRVVHPANRGFGAACLSGVEAARAPLVVLLNSDVAVREGFLAPLLTPFAHDPQVFSVSPLILDREGRPSKISVNHPQVRRGELKWRGVPPEALLSLSRLPADAPLELYSLFGLGGAIAVRRDRFLALGGFDPLYRPFYHEDVDLGLCAWRRGWTVRVEPRSLVTHADGGTINRHFAPLRVKIARRRHRLLCGWKHAEGSWRGEQRRGLWRRALTRWLSLDLRFYAALWGAWRRRAQARAARAREEREGVVSLLDEAFPRIAASWPPPASIGSGPAPSPPD